MKTAKTKIKYLITGVMNNGRRFRLNTCNRTQALGISLMRGSVYAIDQNGRRERISKVV